MLPAALMISPSTLNLGLQSHTSFIIGSLTGRPSNYTTSFPESLHITKSADLQAVTFHISTIIFIISHIL